MVTSDKCVKLGEPDYGWVRRAPHELRYNPPTCWRHVSLAGCCRTGSAQVLGAKHVSNPEYKRCETRFILLLWGVWFQAYCTPPKTCNRGFYLKGFSGFYKDFEEVKLVEGAAPHVSFATAVVRAVVEPIWFLTCMGSTIWFLTCAIRPSACDLS